MTEPLRLILADDHTLFREGLAELLRVESDLTVVAQAGDTESAVRLAGAVRPHAVLLDVEMPYTPVHATIGRLLAICPGIRVLVLTMYDDPELAHRVVGAGAYGMVTKTISRLGLVDAVRAVGYRAEFVPPPPRRVVEPPLPSLLSPREREVLELAAMALSNAQIGSRLFITEGTVKRHLTNIYAKLDAVSRLDAVNKAVASHLIRTPIR
ncbi:response regulator transcription factor [Pilimelia columellifera]|uniref:Response regulator transcription factor n=1 Tax=Pilimelia columellifera subsp. columellifera TaxID=706583 RepID=A0ABP6ANX9_9ACTN